MRTIRRMASGAEGNAVEMPREANEASRAASSSYAAEPERFKEIFAAHPELAQAWRAAQESAPADEIRRFFPTAAHAREASQRLAEFQRLDDLFFSNRPESHAELAALVEQLNPEAFHNLARAMAERSREAMRQGNKEARRSGMEAASEARDVSSSTSSSSPPSSAAFAFHGANAAAVEGVVNAIEQQVNRLLPEEIPAGARNRVVGEIYREVQTSLASDRALTEQLRQAFQSGPGDEQHQQAVAGIVINRVRKILPGAAKRVIEEWTSSVLAASNARRAKQEAGARRVDIAGAPGGDRRRSYSPRDIDYARTSDSDILNL